MNKVIAFVFFSGGQKSDLIAADYQLCGRSHIYWPLEALQNSPVIDWVVAGGKKKMAGTVNSFHFSKVIVYPSDQVSKNHPDQVRMWVKEYIARSDLMEDNIVLMVKDPSPLTISEHFEKALEQFLTSRADAIWGLSPVQKLSMTGTAGDLPTGFSQELLEKGAFYITLIKNLETGGDKLSKVAYYELPAYISLEMDEMIDWNIAEHMMCRYRIKRRKTEDFGAVKLLVSDVDGVLTDGSMYYSEKGDEIKRFHTYDGMAFGLMKERGIKTALITSEDTQMVARRAKKLKIDYLYQGRRHGSKLSAIRDICQKENIDLSEVIYIGDDINCREALGAVGFAFCPSNALPDIKALPNVISLQRKGGEGVIRELYEQYIRPNFDDRQA